MYSISKSSSSPLKYAIFTLVGVLTAAAAHAQPTLTKEFSPSSIGPGSSSTITFTITNGSSSPVTGLAFTDPLPAVPGSMTIADPANASTDCDLGTSGTLSAPEGGTVIALAGARIEGSQTCTVTVDVTTSTPGTFTNPAIALSSSAGGSMSVAADLTVDTGRPGFRKSFAPSTVPFGGRSTLTFTIDNSANGSKATTLSFTDTLPLGMTIADPANASTDCGTAPIVPALVAEAGTSFVSLFYLGNTAFPAVAAGATCTVVVDVTATGTGPLGNVSGNLTATVAALRDCGKASATLDVTLSQLALTKSFTDDPTPPGGTATLELTLYNFDRFDSASGISFTDDLGAALTDLTFSSELSNDCGVGLAGVGTTQIAFTGGALAPESSCTLRVSLAVPPDAVPGAYVNTTSSITGTVGGSPVVGNEASDVFFVEPVPVLTKEFLEVGTLAPDPVISAGDSVVIRFTIANTSTTSGATDVAFIDELTTFLTFPVSVSLPPTPDPPCGAGSSLALVFLDSERQGLSLTGGSLAAGSTCSFDVTVTTGAGLPPGIKVNTTEEITAVVDGATRTGEPASDSFTVVGAPELIKEFIDDPVAPGGTVTLQYTLTYPAEASGPATGITFTDNLAPVLTDLTANLPPSPDPPCGTGSSLTGSAGDTLLTLMGGTLMPGDSCVFSVTLDVPADATPGSHPNTTSGVAATVGGVAVTSLPASDDLVVAGLTFTKEFLGDPVVPGDTVTLRFTIENIHPTNDATITSFSDDLTAVLPGTPDLFVNLPPTANTCGGILTGTSSLTYSGGSVMSGQTCIVEVTVNVPVGAPEGVFANVTGTLFTDLGNIAPAVDSLTVDSHLLQLTKEFTDDPVAPGGTVNLRFTLTNLDAGQTASEITFSDNLADALPGLTFTTLDFGATTCGGGYVGFGTTTFTFDTGTLGPGATCEINATVTVPGGAVAGVYPNTTSTVTGTIGGLAVSGNAASDDLEVVQLLLFSKSFDGPSTATGTATLTFTITNPGADTATNIAFSDNLGDVIPGLVATGGLPALPCGAGSAVTGTSFLTFTGGELPPMGGTCSFDVDVLVPATATAGTFPNTTSELFSNGLKVADPATADLVIEPPPNFAKVFLPDTILAGGVSTLEFTIDNSASAVAANALAFTDNLPAGVVVATPSITSNSCGGSLNAVAGASTIQLTSGASVGAGATCTIDVNVTSLAAGMYVNTTGDLTSSSGSSGFAENTLTVNPAVDVSVTKSDGVTTATPGGSVTYTIVVANAGPSPDPSVTLADAFPSPPLTCTFTSVAAGGATGNTAAGAGDLAETLSLPAGSSVTYTVTCDIDSDATGTLSNTASITPSITDTVPGNNSATDDDTVLVPEADLSITKTDSADPVVPGDEVTYTLTVENAGPSDAHDVVVTDTLPAGVTFVETSGCPEDPNGVPTCTLGTITAGASKQYTVTVTIDNTANGDITNEASVASSTAEANPGDETASETTTVNNGTPPSVTGVSTVAGPLAVCDSLRPPISTLHVRIEDDLGPILHAKELSSYLLVGTGPDGDFSTVACGSASGDDVEIEIVSLSLKSAGPTQVDVNLGLGGSLGDGLYRFFVCDTITDAAGNALDGDGDTSPGVDFEVSFFRADLLNLFDNGNFDDCPVVLAPWISTVTAPNTITPGVAGTDDVDSSQLSASARISHSASPPSSLGQCVPVVGRVTYHLEARLRYDAVASALASFVARCELFDDDACVGTSLGTPSTAVLVEDVGGAWVTVGSDFTSPAGSASALCDFAVGPVGTDPGFDLYVDGLFLGGSGPIFADGFESGDTSTWSSTTP